MERLRRHATRRLGRYYLGGSLNWQAHPLLVLTGTTLINAGDGSAVLLPHADWSLSDNVSLIFGGIFGIGAGRAGDGHAGSEYGAVPQTVYTAIKMYF